MKQLIKIQTLLLLLAVVGGQQSGYAQSGSTFFMNDTTVSACDSFVWHDSVYTQTGLYTYVSEDSTVIDTLHLTVHHPVHTATTAGSCGSYTWHDTTYTESGDYTYSHSDANGCIQVDTLHLTIYNPVHTAVTVEACESYTWTEGTGATYTTSNTYTYAHQDTLGCWQVDTLHLTINLAYHTNLHVSACETYTWNSQTYTESGNYDQTITAANGCDSLVTLHLTIHHGTHNVFTETVCESYTWHGTTYTASGEYTYAYENAQGCASADTLHLTIYHPVHTATTAGSCGSYIWHDATYTESGDYTYSHPDAHGCTQVDTLHLTIHNPVHTATTVTICDSYTWNEGTGLTYVISGTYTYAHQDIHGCTQVDTLHLVINPSPTPFIFGDSSICYGDVTTLTAAGGETYQWSTEDVGNSIVVAMEGLYQVTAINMYGCSSTAEFTVNLAASPLDKKDIVGKSHADGSYYMLIYPEANLQYQWYKNDVMIVGATKQYYYPSDYTLEGSLDVDACYQVEARPNDPDLCGIWTDCWKKPESTTEKILVLPNPNNGQFRLLLPEGTVRVQVLDANGQTLMTRAVYGELVVDMNTNLANGLYLVKTFRQDGSSNTEKLVINR